MTPHISRSAARAERYTVVVWAVLVVLLIGAAHSVSRGETTASPQEGPVNTECPVTPGETVDPRFTVMYEGVEIGLCCRKCETKFNENPEEYFAALMSLSPPAEPEADGHHEAEEHAHDEAQDDGHGDGHGDGHDDASAASNPAGHDHSTDHETDEPKLVSWIGKFHPAATDLPIGLLIGAVLAEMLFMVTKRKFFQNASVFCLWIGAPAAAGVALLGWFHAGFALTDDDWV